jgi:sugar lactone lactonase YvrE
MADRVELVLDAHAEVGEGPLWDHRDRSLLWVDVTRGQVHRLDPATNVDTSVDVGQHVGAVALRERGGLVLAVRGGFAGLDLEEGVLDPIADTEAARPTNRMNDGKVDAAGRFWAGSMAYSETGHDGSLYRLNPDGTVTTAVTGVGISNGLGWSPHNRRMYYIDSLSGVDEYRFDLETGEIFDRRRFIDVNPADGVPDGMTVDADGCLWVALWNGRCVRRYTPDGKLDRTMQLPVAQVTSCTFGGDDLGELYITSAARGLSAGDLRDQPAAGGVFRLRPGVTGLAAAAFAG